MKPQGSPFLPVKRILEEDETRRCEASSSILSRDCSGCSGPLWFLTNFKIDFVCLCGKYVTGNFVKIAWNLYITLCYLTIVSLIFLVHECEISFHLFVSSSVSFISGLCSYHTNLSSPWLYVFLGILLFLMQLFY